MKTVFGDWQDRPLVLITRDLVAKRHQELGENSGAFDKRGRWRYVHIKRRKQPAVGAQPSALTAS